MSGRLKWFLTFWLASVPLWGFWLYGLFDLDEGYYGAVSAEMNRRGEWITPFLNGHPWFEKPILLYWFAKPSISLFGEIVGPRLPCVLATVGLFVLCGLYLRKRVGSETGRWAAIMLGTSILVLGIGRMMMTDALLDIAICGAFLSFYESLVGAKAWRLMTAFCLGIAVLAKGPVSLPLFVALAVWTYISEPELRPAFKGWWLLGTVILAATVCTWYVPAYLENGQVFVQKFFVEQNLQRFSGGDEAHNKVPFLLGPVFYLAILFVGLLPWSVPLVKEWPKALGKLERDSLQRYLARWALVVFIFFSISGTKLPHYILPAVPPLIMIAAIEMAKRKPFSWKIATAWAVGFCILANAVFIGYFYIGGFAELDADARIINQGVGRREVITYQLARVSNGNGLSLNDTSNPSLGFYLNQDRVTYADTASLDELISKVKESPRSDVFVLTRPGRLNDSDINTLRNLGWLGSEIKSGSRYVLYQFSRNST